MRWCLHGAAALLGSLTACSFPADYEGTRYQCTAPGPGECPDGHECRGGFCEIVRDRPDAGGGTFTDAAGGPPDASPVGGVDAGDDGCDSVSSAAGFANPAAWDTVATEEGCKIVFLDGTATLQNEGPVFDCAIQSRDRYRLDQRTWVEVLGDEEGFPSPGFGLVIGRQTLIWRNTPDGLLVFVREEDGFEDVYDGFDFNPFLDRYWGFAPGPGDLIELQMSSDGQTWDTLTEFQPIDDPRTTCVRYEASLIEEEDLSGAAVFQNLNDV